MGFITLIIWGLKHYIVRFRAESLILFCDKSGFSSITSEKELRHTYGSVPFDLESYTCAGVMRVFSDEEIIFYYGSFIFMVLCFLLAVFLVDEKDREGGNFF